MKVVFQAILIIVAIGLASILVISFKIIGYLIGFIITILKTEKLKKKYE